MRHSERHQLKSAVYLPISSNSHYLITSMQYACNHLKTNFGIDQTPSHCLVEGLRALIGRLALYFNRSDWVAVPFGKSLE